MEDKKGKLSSPLHRFRLAQMRPLLPPLNKVEERGSGIGKVIFQIELYQLPLPVLELWIEALLLSYSNL